MNQSIGERICERRKQLGMSQEELAKAMGYKSRSAINKIELGINDINQTKISRFAYVLDTTISYLMGWDEPNESTYILNPESVELLKVLESRPELKALCDAGRKLEPEDVQAILRLIKR